MLESNHTALETQLSPQCASLLRGCSRALHQYKLPPHFPDNPELSPSLGALDNVSGTCRVIHFTKGLRRGPEGNIRNAPADGHGIKSDICLGCPPSHPPLYR